MRLDVADADRLVVGSRSATCRGVVGVVRVVGVVSVVAGAGKCSSCGNHGMWGVKCHWIGM